MLIQLKNGNWVHPMAVGTILAYEGGDCDLGSNSLRLPDRVIVTGNLTPQACLFESYDDACEYRDELALKVVQGQRNFNQVAVQVSGN